MIKILVVDDEENIAQTLRYNLLREGYSVTVRHDGRQALVAFQQENPDMVILDMLLPGMSGVDVWRHMRLNSSVPILILSALEEQVARVAGLEVGSENYMTKPFSLRELILRVRIILRRAGRV
jgi:DNA-binding response OmpR family regulator